MAISSAASSTTEKERKRNRRYAKKYALKKMGYAQRYWNKVLKGLGWEPIQRGRAAKFLADVPVKNKKQLNEWVEATYETGGLEREKDVGPVMVMMVKSIFNNVKSPTINSPVKREDHNPINNLSTERLFMEKLGKRIANVVSMESPELFEELRKSGGARIAPAEAGSMNGSAYKLLEDLMLFGKAQPMDCAKEAREVLECLGKRRYVMYQEVHGKEYAALTPAGMAAIWDGREKHKNPWGRPPNGNHYFPRRPGGIFS